MTDSYSFEKLRPLGILEKYCTSRYSLNQYQSVGISAAYHVPPTITLTRITFRHVVFLALAKVIAAHPSLSVIPLDIETKAPYYVRLPFVDLQRAVSFVDRKRRWDSENGNERGDGNVDPELDELLGELHSRHWRDNLGEVPFWRLMVLLPTAEAVDEPIREFVASFTYCHAISDGTSGVAFHRAFQDALASTSLDLSTAKATIEAPSKIPQAGIAVLLPPQDILSPLPVSPVYLLRNIYHEYIAPPPPTLWAGPRIPPLPLPSIDPTPIRTHFRTLTFSSKTTDLLATSSRFNKTTVTGTIETLVASAVFSCLDEKYTQLAVYGAISLRRFIDPEIVNDRSIGVWVGAYRFTHHRSQALATSHPSKKDFNAFWEEARLVRQEIKALLARKCKDSPLGLIAWADGGDLRKFFGRKTKERRAGKGVKREIAFEYSNVGVWKGDVVQDEEIVVQGKGERNVNNGKWRVGRMVFSQSADVAGAAMEVSIITGGDGRLVVGISWLEGVMKGRWMTEVMERLREGVETLIGGQGHAIP